MPSDLGLHTRGVDRPVSIDDVVRKPPATTQVIVKGNPERGAAALPRLSRRTAARRVDAYAADLQASRSSATRAQCPCRGRQRADHRLRAGRLAEPFLCELGLAGGRLADLGLEFGDELAAAPEQAGCTPSATARARTGKSRSDVRLLRATGTPGAAGAGRRSRCRSARRGRSRSRVRTGARCRPAASTHRLAACSGFP